MDYAPSVVPSRRVSSLPDGTAFSRYLMVLGAANGSAMNAKILSERFIDTPQVKSTFELMMKAAVPAASTSDASFAGPLAVHGIAREALALIRGKSIVGALEGKMRRVPFRTKVPRETGSGTGGAWVGQGLSTPAAATAYDTLTVEQYKAGRIVAMSKELLKLGDPSAERVVRETVSAGVAAYVDQQFLLPTVTLSANLRPASVTNGATAITSTGTTAAQINADMAALLAAVTTPGPHVWIMQPRTAYRIAATIGGTAAVNVPTSLFGIPLILSANSPQQITLLDPQQILFADDGGIELDSSEEALLQLDTAPTDTTMPADVMTSLFQSNLWAVRCLRWVAWLRAQSGSVAYMTVSY
jgi:HK97 family phage major capsid protein